MPKKPEFFLGIMAGSMSQVKIGRMVKKIKERKYVVLVDGVERTIDKANWDEGREWWWKRFGDDIVAWVANPPAWVTESIKGIIPDNTDVEVGKAQHQIGLAHFNVTYANKTYDVKDAKWDPTRLLWWKKIGLQLVVWVAPAPTTPEE